MDRIMMESSEWNALLISGVTRSVYWSGCCVSCCAAVLDVWRHPVKVNAAAMHAMAMTICSFMICDGCDVFYWSARSAAQRCGSTDPAPVMFGLQLTRDCGVRCSRIVGHSSPQSQ